MKDTSFTLNIGCHRGTITSRDSMSEPYDTYQEAFSAYLRHKAFYKSIGYQVWFADIVYPDGESKHLESNPYYG